MYLIEIFTNKSLRPKEKTKALADCILTEEIQISELLTFAASSKDAIKATCIEALEIVTQQHQITIDESVLHFVGQNLASKAPRVKWESAKVMGNIAKLFPHQIEHYLASLILNTKHEGTVVRWSAAYALSQIILLQTEANQTLLPVANQILASDEKNSIKKIYQQALK